uniref:Reverse transcriptase domain-containing protein n=1 Tax=Lactuca sativa TaxID=4236 RepID=A0A9R1V3R8_LACSA|nr:hypothetical protein LSAT_V11C700375200 [Lactuca sativa]
MNEIKKEAESRALMSTEMEERSIGGIKIAEHARTIALDLKQRAKIKWEVEGDENTCFFHGYVNNRNKKNHIHGIMTNGIWMTDPVVINKEATRFFERKYRECWRVRPVFRSEGFRKLLEEDTRYLEGEFSMGEVKNAIWLCGGNKSLGPDGFTFKFLKKFWELLKGDIMGKIKYFEAGGKITRGCNSSSISLAAKTKDPLHFCDFRPISLIGSIYKIIAKLLALRLKKVIGGVIDEVQSAYVEGRNILEGPLVVNALCSWAKSKGRKMLLFKAYFNKAFDSVNWVYLDSIMNQMGFGNKWRYWIRNCLESGRASVIINGSPTNEFSMTKGVRQGGPLSPFLFIIAMEGLNVAMKTAIEKGVFDGSRVFGIGVSPSEVLNWSAPLGCEPSSLPFTYLGIPVGENMNRKNAWRPIVEKFHCKLSLWKAKTLSFGGRLTLAKVVLGSLPTYYMSIFTIPNGIIETLEKIRRRFIWSSNLERKSISWVAWETLITPKKMWRLKNEYTTLWAKVILCIHDLDGRHRASFVNISRWGVWKNIIKIRTALKKFHIDFKEILYWKPNDDCWASDFVVDNHFSVRLLRERIEMASHIVCDSPFEWCKVITNKILCFIWSAKLGRIPSSVSLKARGVPMSSIICGSCNMDEETCDYILLLCPVTKVVMNSILSWCEISHDGFYSVKDMLIFISRWSKSKKEKKHVEYDLICRIMVNHKVFRNIPIVPKKTVEKIKSITFVWCKHKGSFKNMDRRVWNLGPFLCL